MATDLYSIGLSGVIASSAKITTSGQNTANVNTEGYSRQTTALAADKYGRGVHISTTKRIVDEFANAQVRADTTTYKSSEAYFKKASSVDEIFSDVSTSLNTFINTAFDSLQAVNGDPTDLSTRNIAFTDLASLIDQYNALAGFSKDQARLVNEQLESEIREINEISRQVSNMNEKILIQETMTGDVANELRDNQEELIRQVSEYLDVKITYDKNNLVELQLGGGQPLVLQDQVHELALEPSEFDRTISDLNLEFPDYTVGIEPNHLGGSIGGLLDYRHGFLQELDRYLGQQALVFTETMNRQNRLGLDMNGEFGGDLILPSEIRVYESHKNSSDRHDVSVRVQNGKSSELTIESYNLVMTSDTAFEVRAYDVAGNSTGPAIFFDMETSEKSDDGYFSIPGVGLEVKLETDYVKGFKAGDMFYFAPTRDAAEDITMKATSGRELAVNAPIQVANDPENLSDARVVVSSMHDMNPKTSAFKPEGDGLYPAAPHTIRFTSENAFEVLDQNDTLIGFVTDVNSYNNLLKKAGLDSAGYDVSLTLRPAAGDVFTIGFNESGRSDNTNGRALAELQNKALVAGSHSFTEAYAGLVSRIGNLTSTAEVTMDSSAVMLEQSKARRDDISAVSLDEEAVNLVRFQNSYSASSQVLSAAETVFQTLLSAIG